MQLIHKENRFTKTDTEDLHKSNGEILKTQLTLIS